MSRRGENIFKRNDGRWEARYEIGRKENGRIAYRSIYGKSYKEIKEKLRVQRLTDANCKNRKFIGYESQFSNYADEWFNNVASKNKHSTYVKYQNVYKKYIFNTIGEMKFSDISPDTVKNLFLILNDKVKNEEISLSTFNSVKSVLKRIILYYAPDFPFTAVMKDITCSNNKKNQPAVFTNDERTRLEEYMLDHTDAYKLGIIICLYTGLRIGEICALKTSSVNLTKRSLSVDQTVQRIRTKKRAQEKKTELVVTSPKTFSSQREIPICDSLFKIIIDSMPKTEYILGTTPLDPRTYQYKFKKYLKNLSVTEKNFHALRHTFATNCIESGMDPKCLSEILGHSDVKTTLNRYVHPSFDNKMQQINIFANNCNFNGQPSKK